MEPDDVRRIKNFDLLYRQSRMAKVPVMEGRFNTMAGNSAAMEPIYAAFRVFHDWQKCHTFIDIAIGRAK